jgi:hypothetical protein
MINYSSIITFAYRTLVLILLWFIIYFLAALHQDNLILHKNTDAEGVTIQDLNFERAALWKEVHEQAEQKNIALDRAEVAEKELKKLKKQIDHLY